MATFVLGSVLLVLLGSAVGHSSLGPGKSKLLLTGSMGEEGYLRKDVGAELCQKIMPRLAEETCQEYQVMAS